MLLPEKKLHGNLLPQNEKMRFLDYYDAQQFQMPIFYALCQSNTKQPTSLEKPNSQNHLSIWFLIESFLTTQLSSQTSEVGSKISKSS